MSYNLGSKEVRVIFEGSWCGTGRAVRIVVERGTVGSVEELSAPGGETILSPGFLDIQVNGYFGIDYSSEELSLDRMETLSAHLLRSGTTRHIPTIITNSQERILENLRRIAEARDGASELREAIPGIHVEGPYIASEDGPRGAHDPRYVRDPNVEELRRWIDASRGLLKVVTLAPERKGAIPFIRALLQEGITPAIGHTAASPKQIAEAVEAGARLSTHLGNGSHALLPRLRNYLWEQLASDGLTAGIIADGYHLPPSVMKIFHRVKGRERLLLVSDVGPMGGLDVGVHKWGNIEVEVHPDGHLGLPGTEFLAGAGHLLDRSVAQFLRATGASMEEAIYLVTEGPAAELGIGAGESVSRRDTAGVAGRGFVALPKVGERANLLQFRYETEADAISPEAVTIGERSWRKRRE